MSTGTATPVATLREQVAQKLIAYNQRLDAAQARPSVLLSPEATALKELLHDRQLGIPETNWLIKAFSIVLDEEIPEIPSREAGGSLVAFQVKKCINEAGTNNYMPGRCFMCLRSMNTTAHLRYNGDVGNSITPDGYGPATPVEIGSFVQGLPESTFQRDLVPFMNLVA